VRKRLPENVLSGPSSALSPGQHSGHPVHGLPPLLFSSTALLLSDAHVVEGRAERRHLAAHVLSPSLSPEAGIAEAPKLGVGRAETIVDGATDSRHDDPDTGNGKSSYQRHLDDEQRILLSNVRVTTVGPGCDSL
jgi:hypothetical protein